MPLKEHDVVSLINSVKGLPAGTKGTIVHVYEGANAYEVEFISKKFNVDNWVIPVSGFNLKKENT